MTPFSKPSETNPSSGDASCGYVPRLGAALAARGLAVTMQAGSMVTARNRAADPPQEDQRARVLSPGLVQPVVWGPREDTGDDWWFWVWAGPTRDAEPEYEPLCPADEIETAADRIAAVIAVAPNASPLRRAEVGRHGE